MPPLLIPAISHKIPAKRCPPIEDLLREPM